jgi:putative transposase
VRSHDVIVFEDLQVRNMVKNHHLAKSTADAGWRSFIVWTQDLANVYGKKVVIVPPQ